MSKGKKSPEGKQGAYSDVAKDIPAVSYGGQSASKNSAMKGAYSDQKSDITPKQGSGNGATKAATTVKTTKGDGIKGEQRESQDLPTRMVVFVPEFSLPDWEMTADELSFFLSELESVNRISVWWTGIA